MSNFLNDLGLSGVNADPNYLPEGKYPAQVYKFTFKDVPAKGDKPASKALIITYRVSHLDPANQGKLKTEYKALPRVNADGTFADDDSQKNASYLKQRMLSFGIPESEMDSMKQEEIIGTPVWINIVQVGEYMNIRSVELRDEEFTGGQL